MIKRNQIIFLFVILGVITSLSVWIFSENDGLFLNRDTNDIFENSVSFEKEVKPECQMMVYYFHRTVRCPTCLEIENLTQRTLQTNFYEILKEGIIEWHAINMEDASNQPFVERYRLTAPSLIFVRMKNGRQTQWKNLEGIWNNVEVPEYFFNFITTEIDNYLNSTS